MQMTMVFLITFSHFFAHNQETVQTFLCVRLYTCSKWLIEHCSELILEQLVSDSTSLLQGTPVCVGLTMEGVGNFEKVILLRGWLFRILEYLYKNDTVVL